MGARPPAHSPSAPSGYNYEYDAVRDDLKTLNQKIEDGIKQCTTDTEKLVTTVQNNTRHEIDKINKNIDTKIDKGVMEAVLAQRAEKTYASKIKNEVDEHLTGMDSQISKVKDKIDEVRKKNIN